MKKISLVSNSEKQEKSLGAQFPKINIDSSAEPDAILLKIDGPHKEMEFQFLHLVTSFGLRVLPSSNSLNIDFEVCQQSS